MKIKPLKFAHDFTKLHGQTSGKLTDISEVMLTEDVHPDAVAYDTEYKTGKMVEMGSSPDKMVGEVTEYYPLPKGGLFRLTFLGNKGIPFTTYRRFKSPAWKYYLGLKNAEFQIVVETKPDGEQEKLEV